MAHTLEEIHDVSLLSSCVHGTIETETTRALEEMTQKLTSDASVRSSAHMLEKKLLVQHCRSWICRAEHLRHDTEGLVEQTEARVHVEDGALAFTLFALLLDVLGLQAVPPGVARITDAATLFFGHMLIVRVAVRQLPDCM